MEKLERGMFEHIGMSELSSIKSPINVPAICFEAKNCDAKFKRRTHFFS